jgi:hypothetical protein
LPGPLELLLAVVLMLVLSVVVPVTLESLLFLSWPLGPCTLAVVVTVVEIVVVVVVFFVPLLVPALSFGGVLPLLPIVLSTVTSVVVCVLVLVLESEPHPLCSPSPCALEASPTLAIATVPRMAVTFRTFRMTPPLLIWLSQDRLLDRNPCQIDGAARSTAHILPPSKLGAC